MFLVPLIPGRHEVTPAACLLKKCEILSLTFSVMLLKGFMASCFEKKKKKKDNISISVGSWGRTCPYLQAELWSPPCFTPALQEESDAVQDFRGSPARFSPSTAGLGPREKRGLHGENLLTTVEPRTAHSPLCLGCHARLTPNQNDLCRGATWKLCLEQGPLHAGRHESRRDGNLWPEGLITGVKSMEEGEEGALGYIAGSPCTTGAVPRDAWALQMFSCRHTTARISMINAFCGEN